MLYDILGLKKDATFEEIKKNYKKMALLKHPDKNPNDKDAADNFQKLQKAYSVVSDPKKRERYDQWGDDGTDTFNSAEWMNAYEYYRSCHPEISKDDVTTYTNKYKGSKDEEQDLIKFYKNYHGNVTKILEHIIASETSDIPRFVKFYLQCFEDGVLVKTDKFIKTSIRIKLLDDEEEAADHEINNIHPSSNL